jgi:hypothetical protein
VKIAIEATDAVRIAEVLGFLADWLGAAGSEVVASLEFFADGPGAAEDMCNDLTYMVGVVLGGRR